MIKLTKREKGLLICLAALGSVYLADFIYRYWSPDIVKETEHFQIYSSATAEQTDEIAEVAEILYTGYGQLMTKLQQQVKPHSKLKVKLFRDRDEFQRCNRIRNGPESFYRKPYSYQYYSADEANPYHWMVHEATHQLNVEAAGLKPAQWLDEGIASYVSTSQIVDGSFSFGQIDPNTYPTWWFGSMSLTGNLDMDKKIDSVVPLRAIITGQGGPGVNKWVNLYYLHWWSLAHFLFHYEDSKYVPGLSRLIEEGGSLPAFEKYIGPVDQIEQQWYEYTIDLRKRLYNLESGTQIIR
jgi:hypothetical protein